MNQYPNSMTGLEMNSPHSIDHILSSMPVYPPLFPICIDLDGTLVQEHTMWHLSTHYESWLSFLKNSFPAFWPLIKWKMASACDLQKTNWTYHTLLIEQLKIWHQQGAALYLVTGAPEKIAHFVAQRIGLFSDVWASSPRHNLVGQNKADFLCTRFGALGYTYVGDSWKDLPVWKTSRDVIAVSNAQSPLVQHLNRIVQHPARIFCMPHVLQKSH